MQINLEIRDKEIRLIDENGVMLGILPTSKANHIADERNLDLVKISPQATPPVCKLLDYKKYRFDQLKKEKDDKKNRNVVETKEIRLSAVIDVGDVETKLKKARGFIADGDNVKLSLRLKGRQQAHPEIAVAVVEEFRDKLLDIAQADKKPAQEGRNISLLLTPITKKQ